MDFKKILEDKLSARKSKIPSEPDWDDPFGETPKLESNQIISDGKILTLNEGQFQALQTGKKFFNNEEIDGKVWNFMSISGSAGSGKTTIAKAVLYGVYNVVVTAPTHKAKKIVSRATGYKGETIQKILGLRPDVMLEDFKQDNILFSMSGKSLLDSYKVILIDEASMLNKDMVALLKQKAIEFDIKLIFLGDSRQLPPVKETMSKVFVDEDILQVKLIKVERQQVGNPLINIYDKILTHIDNVDKIQLKLSEHEVQFKKDGIGLIKPPSLYLMNEELEKIPFEFVSDISPEGVGYEFIGDKAEFGEKIMSSFKIGEDLDNKVLAWQNDTVRLYNKSIRNKLIGNSNLPPQEGEVIMAYNSVTDKDDWRRLLYENSADYMITKVMEGYRPASNYDEKIKADIKGYFITIEDIDNDRSREKVFLVAKESYEYYIKIEQDYAIFAQQAKNNKKWAWKQYFDFRNQFAVMADIRDSYVGKVKSPKKVSIDFDFSYCITIHKSQGSTYQNIFLVNDIYHHPNPSEKWRLAYVGLSRPRQGAYILNT